MPDWRQLVQERLGALGLGSASEEEVCAELAEHLEDAYQGAVERGLSHNEAVASALEQVPDWKRLARGIRGARREEDAVSHTTRTIWLPGVTAMLFSAMLLLAMVRLVPPTLWVSPNAPTRLLIPWLCAYSAFGAMGAWWSRRAGGNTKERFFSGVFPLAMHLTILVLPVIATAVSADPRFPEHLNVFYLLRTALVWVVVPGVALALGTLPFLRERATA